MDEWTRGKHVRVLEKVAIFVLVETRAAIECAANRERMTPAEWCGPCYAGAWRQAGSARSGGDGR